MRVRKIRVEPIAQISMTARGADGLTGHPHARSDDKALVNGSLQGDVGTAEGGHVANTGETGVQSPTSVQGCL